MATKYHIYDLLARLGTENGYSVLPEFEIELDIGRTKKVDMVWANLNAEGLYKPEVLFEIEGADVPMDTEKGLRRHIVDFKSLTEINRENKIVILYDEAYGRNWDNEKDYDGHINRRKIWSEEKGAEYITLTCSELEEYLHNI